MEVLVSAVLGDVISKSISFFVNRYHRQQTGSAGETLERLRPLLLRAQSIVEEAERRHITNQAMLRQLDTLRQGMYGGYYMLDAFTGRAEGNAMAKVEVSHDWFALCRFSPAKRLCLTARTPKKMVSGGKGLNELREVLCGLETIVADMEEFVLFLKSYPPMCRQPCSRSYLSSGMCMFGRHSEYERTVSFLLQIGTANLSVLPIVGPVRVGKSTLVEHVCYDKRVRSYFSSIVFFAEDDLQGVKADGNALQLQESGVIKHRNGESHGRLLIIIELIGDFDKEIWRRLCSLLNHMAHGSKVIVTSRSENIMQFGTTRAVKLNVLPQEAYWYLFKMIALGRADGEDYPELSSIAMEIAAELNASFSSANIIGTFLRANLDVGFWRKVLEHLREFNNKHLLMFGEHPVDLMQKDRPVYLWRMTGSSEALIAHRCYQVCSPQHKIPKLTMHDILSGRAIPHGNFEVLAWKSQIPPYYSYLMSCSIMTSRHMVLKKKRSRLQSI
uniref:Uncharacterized protein n=1 Tax=Avena sativa TaxID=4498 RepID=A0ACD5W3A4_AVESA